MIVTMRKVTLEKNPIRNEVIGVLCKNGSIIDKEMLCELVCIRLHNQYSSYDVEKILEEMVEKFEVCLFSSKYAGENVHLILSNSVRKSPLYTDPTKDTVDVIGLLFRTVRLLKEDVESLKRGIRNLRDEI